MSVVYRKRKYRQQQISWMKVKRFRVSQGTLRTVKRFLSSLLFLICDVVDSHRKGKEYTRDKIGGPWITLILFSLGQPGKRRACLLDMQEPWGPDVCLLQITKVCRLRYARRSIVNKLTLEP